MKKNRSTIEDDLNIKEVRSDPESETNLRDGGSNKTGHVDEEETELKQDMEEIMDDPLDKIPPDFSLAYKHRDANRVKNIKENVGEAAVYDDEEGFCECCQMPTSKVAPPFKLCTNTFDLEDLG